MFDIFLYGTKITLPSSVYLLEVSNVAAILWPLSDIFLITNGADYILNINKQTKVKQLEKEIDNLIYKLYKLDDKEIERVEETL